MKNYRNAIGTRNGQYVIQDVVTKDNIEYFCVKCDCENIMFIMCSQYNPRKKDYCKKCIEGTPLISFIGRTFGTVTVLSFVDFNKNPYLVTTKCSKCGVTIQRDLRKLTKQTNHYCGFCSRISQQTAGYSFNHPKDYYIGKQFGKLTIIKFVDVFVSKGVMVKCECGTMFKTSIYDLFKGSVTQCKKCRKPPIEAGKRALQKLAEEKNRLFKEKHIGERFGRLVILGVTQNKPKKVLCKCDCGNVKEILYCSLQGGKTRSCGCLHRELLSKNATKYSALNKHGYDWYFLKDNKKIPCRSGFEVLYAHFLEQQKISYVYEPKTFTIPKLGNYTPDFYLPAQNKYIEIKGHIFSCKQLQKINTLRQQGINIEILYWEQIRQLLNIRYKSYTSFFKKAKKLKIPINDFLALHLYQSV